MATVTCPKCSAKVDTDLKACPKCGLSRMAEVKQNSSRRIVKIALIPFNVFLAVWMLSALNILPTGASNAEAVASASQVSPIYILAIWVIIDLLLVGYLWFKKPAKPY